MEPCASQFCETPVDVGRFCRLHAARFIANGDDMRLMGSAAPYRRMRDVMRPYTLGICEECRREGQTELVPDADWIELCATCQRHLGVS